MNLNQEASTVINNNITAKKNKINGPSPPVKKEKKETTGQYQFRSKKVIEKQLEKQ